MQKLAQLFFHTLLEKSKELNKKIEELEALHNALYSIGGVDYSKDRVDGGIPSDLADKMARVMKKQKKTGTLNDEVIAMRDAAEILIKLLPNKDQQRVLSNRYILGLTWEQVAESVGHSERWTYDLEAQAFRDLNKNHEKKLKYFSLLHLKSLHISIRP